jgi:hypothetical protein
MVLFADTAGLKMTDGLPISTWRIYTCQDDEERRTDA